MAFAKMPGVKGMIYIPETQGEKKHDCPDCYFCQMCSDDRCSLCLKGKKSCCKKDNFKKKTRSA